MSTIITKTRYGALNLSQELSPEGLRQFHARQLAVWPEARERYAALAEAPVKDYGDYEVVLVPGRKHSSTARTAAEYVQSRPCFLCRKNRPACQEGIAWRDYEILVNPYPILPEHFTIATVEHQPQKLTRERLGDMAELARMLPGFTIFFNGATAGASAPDHLHLQAVGTDRLPIWRRKGVREEELEIGGDNFNLLCRLGDDGEPEFQMVRRRKHRPGCYPDVMVSPGALDVAGRFVTVRQEDFDRVDGDFIHRIMEEICQ